VWCDNTSEFLTGMLRTGRAGSTTATDHIALLTDAISQGPPPSQAASGPLRRRGRLLRPAGVAQRAGQIRGRSPGYSIGFSLTKQLSRPSGWFRRRSGPPRSTPTARSRAGADVAEITGLLGPGLLATWPLGGVLGDPLGHAGSALVGEGEWLPCR